MKISIIGGSGYVGLVSGIGLACLGHDVICHDVDEIKIRRLNDGSLPIYEDGLDRYYRKAMMKNRITFTCNLPEAVAASDFIFFTIGTPMAPGGEADLDPLMEAVAACAKLTGKNKTFIIKSTVPVGTCRQIESRIKVYLADPKIRVDVVSNPEFLKEGSAIADFFHPDRIVIGASDWNAAVRVESLYSEIKAPVVVTDFESAEMIKYSCNAYLASRISFINEIAEIAEKTGADISSVLEGMKLDKRIGPHYLNPGPGFGGPCLNKDISSLILFGSHAGASTQYLKAAMDRNERQIDYIMDSVHKLLGGLKGRKVAVLGLSFKAGTSDTRNSPSVTLINKLLMNGADVSAYDPEVKTAPAEIRKAIQVGDGLYKAASGAQLIIIMTEWEEFGNIDFSLLKHVMKDCMIYDSRNIVNKEKALKYGFQVKSLGSRLFMPVFNGADSPKLMPDTLQV